MVITVCVAANVFALRWSWTQSFAEPGQFQQGYFEEYSGERSNAVGLTFSDPPKRWIFPSLSFGHRRTISLPPGTSAGVTLVPGARYAISGASVGATPYVVLGRTIPATPTAEVLGPSDVHAVRLVAAVAPAIDSATSKLAWSAWNASVPFSEDRRRLHAIAQTCIGPQDAPELAVTVDADAVQLRFGSCTARAPLTPGPADGAWRLALVAADEWLTVARTDGGFRARTSVASADVATWAVRSLFAVATLLFVFGAPTTIVVSLLLLLTSFVVHPFLSALCFMLSAGLAVLGLPVAIARRLPARLSPILRWGAVAACYILVFATMARSFSQADEAGAPLADRSIAERTDLIGGAPGCVLTGYSTVEDVNVRPGTPGTAAYLADDCMACRGGVARYGQSGRSFAAIRQFACADDAPIRPGSPLIFLGGTNDDIILGPDFPFWAKRSSLWNAFATVYETMVRGLYYLRRPSRTRLQRLLNDASERAAPVIAAQCEIIKDAADCAHGRGTALWYYHDFTILDLSFGRSETRRRMLEARRAVVGESGDRFVNLLEVFADEAGVSWFNDYIHLSTLGHRRVAERMCADIAD